MHLPIFLADKCHLLASISDYRNGNTFYLRLKIVDKWLIYIFTVWGRVKTFSMLSVNANDYLAEELTNIYLKLEHTTICSLAFIVALTSQFREVNSVIIFSILYNPVHSTCSLGVLFTVFKGRFLAGRGWRNRPGILCVIDCIWLVMNQLLLLLSYNLVSSWPNIYEWSIGLRT